MPSPEGIWVEFRGHAMRALRSFETHAANRRTRCKFKCSSRAFQREILGLRAPTDESIRIAACFGSRRGGEKALPSPEGKESARDKRATGRREGPAPRSVTPWHHWGPNTRWQGAVSRGYIRNPRSSWCALPISPPIGTLAQSYR